MGICFLTAVNEFLRLTLSGFTVKVAYDVFQEARNKEEKTLISFKKKDSRTCESFTSEKKR